MPAVGTAVGVAAAARPRRQDHGSPTLLTVVPSTPSHVGVTTPGGGAGAEARAGSRTDNGHEAGMSLASDRRAQHPDSCTGAGIDPMDRGRMNPGTARVLGLGGAQAAEFRPARPHSRPRAIARRVGGVEHTAASARPRPLGERSENLPASSRSHGRHGLAERCDSRQETATPQNITCEKSPHATRVLSVARTGRGIGGQRGGGETEAWNDRLVLTLGASKTS